MPQSMKKIWFGPSNMLLRNERQQLGDEVKPFDLRWGKSLIEFRPTVNVSTNLWKEVRFSFWNRTTKATEKIRYVLGNDGKKNDGVLWDDEHGLNQDLAPMLDMAALGEHDVTDHPVHTSGEAKNLARNLLRDNFLDLVKAEGTTVGVPELRAGCRVKVTGNGSPLEGHYFVTGTTHTIDDNGYRTSFTARREQTRDDG
jgi:phage protein D